MRDPVLLKATLHAIRCSGTATRALAERAGHSWLAGSTPLNGQAVQDLIEDGWLKRTKDGSGLVIDAWPSYAGDDPAAPTPIPRG